jgi:hypothetical protein
MTDTSSILRRGKRAIEDEKENDKDTKTKSASEIKRAKQDEKQLKKEKLEAEVVINFIENHTYAIVLCNTEEVKETQFIATKRRADKR